MDPSYWFFVALPVSALIAALITHRRRSGGRSRAATIATTSGTSASDPHSGRAEAEWAANMNDLHRGVGPHGP